MAESDTAQTPHTDSLVVPDPAAFLGQWQDFERMPYGRSNLRNPFPLVEKKVSRDQAPPAHSKRMQGVSALNTLPRGGGNSISTGCSLERLPDEQYIEPCTAKLPD
jgi:hypothetical protein